MPWIFINIDIFFKSKKVVIRQITFNWDEFMVEKTN